MENNLKKAIDDSITNVFVKNIEYLESQWIIIVENKESDLKYTLVCAWEIREIAKDLLYYNDFIDWFWKNHNLFSNNIMYIYKISIWEQSVPDSFQWHIVIAENEQDVRDIVLTWIIWDEGQEVWKTAPIELIWTAKPWSEEWIILSDFNAW